MTPLNILVGCAAPLRSGTTRMFRRNCSALMANVDTDAIIPKQFLKTLTRTGLSRGLFHDMKFCPDGSLNPDFVLNRDAARDAVFLIAGDNFGCGSSREHAPWALLDQGIRCVIAPSFADIFRDNCFKNGIAPVPLPAETCENLADLAVRRDALFRLDMTALRLTDPSGRDYPVAIDPDRAKTLIEGLDDIGVTLRYEADIAAFENARG